MKKGTNIALIIAAGKGTRMEKNIPKQFIKIKNKPIIIYTLECFQNHPDIDDIVVVCLNGWENVLEKYAKKFKITKLKYIVIGGETRFQSLIYGVKKAQEIDKNSIIISHDGVRPFVSQKIITSSLEKIKSYDATTVSIPAIDTMVIVKNDIETKILNREYLYSDQGPQTFRVKEFFKILDNDNYTTVGELYVKKGLKVGVIEGDRYNFKVTHSIDLEFAEFLVKKGLK
ncbi:MAG TPA: IspD/TarI family cytidylyltransferase [Bacilli bacterium]|nr:IspD/TarI family cytidylyltransferase [Bacilli bacterium]